MGQMVLEGMRPDVHRVEWLDGIEDGNVDRKQTQSIRPLHRLFFLL